MPNAIKPPKRKSSFGVFDFISKWTSSDKVRISQDEIDYFREHPEEIDDFSSPVLLHQLFLVIGIALGVFGVALAKALIHLNILEGLPTAFIEFLTDIIFEVGVALIGASIVTFMMGIVMNQQQKNAMKWREEIRKQIADADTSRR